MPRDGVGQAGAEHDELVLAFGFRSAGGAAHRVVEAAKLAAGTGIHVAHAADDDVGLVIEIEAVADELFKFDLGRTVEAAFATPITTTLPTPITTGTITTTVAPGTAITAGASATISTGTVTTRTATAWTISTGPTAAFAGRTIFAGCLLLLLFSHVCL